MDYPAEPRKGLLSKVLQYDIGDLNKIERDTGNGNDFIQSSYEILGDFLSEKGYTVDLGLDFSYERWNCNFSGNEEAQVSGQLSEDTSLSKVFVDQAVEEEWEEVKRGLEYEQPYDYAILEEIDIPVRDETYEQIYAEREERIDEVLEEAFSKLKETGDQRYAELAEEFLEREAEMMIEESRDLDVKFGGAEEAVAGD